MEEQRDQQGYHARWLIILSFEEDYSPVHMALLESFLLAFSLDNPLPCCPAALLLVTRLLCEAGANEGRLMPTLSCP